MEASGGIALQAGAGAGEGGLVRALGPGQEAGLRVTEAWEEPLSVGAGGLKAEWARLAGFEEGTGSGGWMAGAGAVTRGGLGGTKVDWGCWVQAAGCLCNSPGSSPDCVLGLTP